MATGAQCVVDDLQQPEQRDTERRRGTVMFADITGFTALVEQSDDEEAYEVVTSCLKLLDGIARRYGATVDKYLGDCIMAVFGVPRAVEDAPRAAVNAAIEMKRAMVRFNSEQGLDPSLDVHIGINTGQVISGDVSGPVLREFAVMGDAVNISARLKDKAPPGEIWVGPETWRCTRHVFDFEEVGSLELKGKRERVAAYAVRTDAAREFKQRSGSRRTVYSELVGREAELTALKRALHDVIGGRGRVVSVVGEPGFGKSRLLAELQDSPEAEGLVWLEGRCLSVGRNLSYHPFQDLFRAWLDIAEDAPDAEARARMDEAVAAALGAEAAEEAVPLLAMALGVRLAAAQRRELASVQGDALERRIRRAVVQLVAGLAEQGPLVLVVDDLHWIDSSSMEILEDLLPLSATHPILFLNVFRPHYEETGERVRGLCELSHADVYEEVHLHPLDERASRRLVDNFFRGGSVPHVTREAIRERAAGNPFFAEEVVRALIDEGAAELRDGVLVATEKIHAFRVPGTIREVLMARIDGLDLPRKRVLEAASVVGQTFWTAVLAEVLEKSDLEDRLQELHEAGLLDPSTRGEGQWTFHHPLIQEVAYETLLRSRRRELHEAVGEAIELLLTDNVRGFHAMLAYHFTQSGNLERAEEYLALAGEQAARSAASSEAIHFFREAVDRFVERYGEQGEPAKRARLEKSLAMALFNKGELIECVDRYEQALVTLGYPTPTSWPALYARFAGELLLVLPRLLGWLKPRRAATDLDREVLEMRFHRCIAETTTDPAFVFHTMATFRMALQRDPATLPEAAAYVAGSAGIFSYGGLSFALGELALARTDEYLAAGHVDRLRLYTELLRFIHHFFRGDWERAEAFDEALLEEGLQNGRLWEFPVALDMDCERALGGGDFGRARRRIDQLTELAGTYEHAYARTAALSLGAFLHLEHGRLDEAFASIERYRELAADLSYQLVAHGTRARILQLLGRLEEAQASLARADELLPHAGMMTPFHRSFVEVPRYHVALATLAAAREAGEATRQARRAARKARRSALRLAPKVAARRTEILRLAAHHDWLLGRHTRAAAGYLKSLEVAEGLGALPELARTCAALARRLEAPDGPSEAAGKDAAAYRERARSLAAQLGLEEAAVGLA